MSEAQERRKQESWDNHWAPIFEKAFQELRDEKVEIDKLPSDSEEHKTRLEAYNQSVESLKEDYMRLHP